MIRLLEKLCALNGVSGTEDEVREYIKKHASKYTDDIRTDAMGNLRKSHCCRYSDQGSQRLEFYRDTRS